MIPDAIKQFGPNGIKIAKVACLNDLMFFTRYMFRAIQNQKYIVARHHLLIAEAMEKVYRGETTRLIIQIAPRYGKTTLVVQNGIAKGLALNPASKYIHLSYSDDLALDNSERIRDIVKSPEYQMLFPEVQIRPGTDSKKKWYTTVGGGVYATSSSGQITGFGAGIVEAEMTKEQKLEYELKARLADMQEGDEIEDFLKGFEEALEFGGGIFIDDPSKPDEVHSDIIRERINNKFDSTIKNRVNSRKTPIVITMQGLHERDLGQYVQLTQPSVWTVLKLPAIYYELENGIEVAKALWPHMHTLEELRDLEKVNPFVFYPQYMQDFSTKSGKLFPESELNFYNHEGFYTELVEYKLATVDPSDTGGDDLSAPLGELVGSDIYITSVIYNTDGEEVNSSAIISMVINNKVNKVKIESNSAWAMFRKKVKAGVDAAYPQCDVRSVTQREQKHIRILNQEGYIKRHMRFRSDYRNFPQYEKFMRNLTSYNKVQEGFSRNTHDDAPDSLAELMKFFRDELPQVF